VFGSESSLLLTPLHSCLAHVINLATQLLISTYSKSPHFDPRNPDGHIPTSRDEVGLVRAIAVKVSTTYEFRVVDLMAFSLPQERSSSKRKEMWRMVQTKAGSTKPVQLILDMKVRWSSTYMMLDRAERNRAVSWGSYEHLRDLIEYFTGCRHLRQ
jgi:hypothetical protein